MERDYDAICNSKFVNSDLFRIWYHKRVMCPKRGQHEWSSCPFGHQSEVAIRRDPRMHECLMCPDITKDKECSLGDGCPYAHSVFEHWLHPQKYRTAMCSEGVYCQRRLCFFAHTPEELRTDINHPPVPEPYEPSVKAILQQIHGYDQQTHMVGSVPGPRNSSSPRSSSGGGAQSWQQQQQHYYQDSVDADGVGPGYGMAAAMPAVVVPQSKSAAGAASTPPPPKQPGYMVPAAPTAMGGYVIPQGHMAAAGRGYAIPLMMPVNVPYSASAAAYNSSGGSSVPVQMTYGQAAGQQVLNMLQQQQQVPPSTGGSASVSDQSFEPQYQADYAVPAGAAARQRKPAAAAAGTGGSMPPTQQQRQVVSYDQQVTGGDSSGTGAAVAAAAHPSATRTPSHSSRGQNRQHQQQQQQQQQHHSVLPQHAQPNAGAAAVEVQGGGGSSSSSMRHKSHRVDALGVSGADHMVQNNTDEGAAGSRNARQQQQRQSQDDVDLDSRPSNSRLPSFEPSISSAAGATRSNSRTARKDEESSKLSKLNGMLRNALNELAVTQARASKLESLVAASESFMTKAALEALAAAKAAAVQKVALAADGEDKGEADIAVAAAVVADSQQDKVQSAVVADADAFHPDSTADAAADGEAVAAAPVSKSLAASAAEPVTVEATDGASKAADLRPSQPPSQMAAATTASAAPAGNSNMTPAEAEHNEEVSLLPVDITALPDSQLLVVLPKSISVKDISALVQAIMKRAGATEVQAHATDVMVQSQLAIIQESRQALQGLQQDVAQGQQALQLMRRQRDAYEVKYRVHKVAKRKADAEKDKMAKELQDAKEAADKAWEVVAHGKNIDSWADDVSENAEENTGATPGDSQANSQAGSQLTQDGCNAVS